MRFWKKCPLFLMLLFSGCLIWTAGAAGADSIYREYRNESGIAVGISSVFRGWKDGVYPWMLILQPHTRSEAVAANTEEPDMEQPETEQPEAEQYGDQELIVPAESHSPEYDKFGVLISDEAVSIDIEEETEMQLPDMNDLADENRIYEFTAVGEDYFNDALFIGDSRTVGLASYAGFQPETDFWAATSTTIHHIFEQPKKIAVSEDGRKVTVEEALREKQYGKIYIMLGINELGRGTTASFFTSYAETVNQIRLLQPDALIFVQGIMRVSSEKSSTDPVYRNETINERNNALAMMADQQDIFYLEVNEAVCDETGGLISEFTYDQVHLKAKYYQLWKEYLFSHGIVRE